MGKSSTSCFNIITCGGGDAGVREDDILSHSVKVPGDKRRWSFCKKSSTCRILSNSLDVDTAPSLLNKTINSETSDFHDQTVYSVEDKISVSIDGKSSPPASKELKTLQNGDVGDEESKVDENTEEDYFAVVLESSINMLLAQDKMENIKSLVKVQAVVRGHLVRRQAIGTLRCIRAIIKIQGLVRNRQLCALLEKSNTGGKQTDIHDEDSFLSVAISPSVYNPTMRSTSLERLLANRFARQLTKAEPKWKPLVLRCDPLNPGSAAWLWLQRWMSVSSSSHQYRAAEYNDSIVKNPASGTKMSTNPEFIRAKSKFQELRLATTDPYKTKLCQPIIREGRELEKRVERGEERTPERVVEMRGVEKSQCERGDGNNKCGKWKRGRGEGDEQESRESTSSSSVRSYMLTTESARAKIAQVSNSPKSSPDVGGDGEFVMRKRHSLSGSMSHNIPQHRGKPNLSSSARHRHERSWQR